MGAEADRSIEAAADILAGVTGIAVLTGAGVSAESGVPTFRGAGGFWKGRSAMDLATPQAFRRDPEGVWEFYRFRIAGLAEVVPNAGHRALADLEDLFERFWLITQNVDGLHRAAGSRNVIELHGSLQEAHCQSCSYRCSSRDLPAQPVPICPQCGGQLRPTVVWFGESLPGPALADSEEAIRQCDVMIVVGTSGVVEPAASFARWARSRGARIVEINLESTPISEVADISLFGPAGVTLPRLVHRIRRGQT
ncbi:MAG: NAD-dependent deacylase [Gemmatimonadetes bacterium]|nr:NAD-dependent deacylase [Gemmatimonadota bacterium]